MAQLMRYHQYPSQGIGVHEKTITVDGETKTAFTRGGDGAGGAYDWAAMPLVPSSEMSDTERQAIGALCYDAGVSIQTMYTSTESSASGSYIAGALTETFQYPNGLWMGIGGLSLDIYSARNALNSNLDAGFPALLSISGDFGGHEVICDGYGFEDDTAYHHLNMGCGGMFDIWYALPTIEYYSTILFDVLAGINCNIYPEGNGEIVSGRVLDTTGEPVTHAVVSMGTLSTNSNEKGIYAFPKITAGDYELSVSTTNGAVARTVTVMDSETSGACGNLWGVDLVLKQHLDSWHEPDDVYGIADPVTAYAYFECNEDEVGVAAIAWRALDGTWSYEPADILTFDNGGLQISASFYPEAVGDQIEYYGYVFTYDMQLICSQTNEFAVNSLDLYVSKSGSQTWPYSSLSTAYTNLTEALADASTEAVIYVDSGRWEGGVELVDSQRLISLNGAEQTILDASGLDSTVLALNGSSFASGFTLTQGDAENGGGAYLYGGTLAGCIITNNCAASYGGGIYMENGALTNCMISDNDSDSCGGGVCMSDGLLQNCLISRNYAVSDGGGVEAWGGVIRNCTITENATESYGGGVDMGGLDQIENCIVVENTAMVDGENWYEWLVPEMRYTCTSPLYDGIGNIVLDPLFADASSGDYHLQSSYGHFTTNGWVIDLADSPCIDFGNPADDASNESPGSRINMGAYGDPAEASRSGTNETRLIVQAEDGSTDPAAGLHIYSTGDSATISLTDNPFTVGTTQYQFSAWTLDDGWSQTTSTAESVTCAMTSNWIVRAAQDVLYRLDLTSEDHGTVTPGCSWVAAGSDLTVTAVPDLYYAFDGWSGTLTTNANPLSIELTQPLALSAAFTTAYTSSGVPQWWLGQYGLTNDFEAAAVADQDGDGSLTWEEYIEGTFPTDSSSVLKLCMDLQPGTNSLSWMAQADRTYTLYYGTNLINGITNVLVEYYSLFPISLCLPDDLHADQPSVFYRLEVEYDGD
jgi:hypothetical protein